MNSESILVSIKKLLGLTETYEAFDPDIIIYINTVITILTQIGLGPSEGFAIHDETDLWSDFIPNDPRLESVKTYIYLKVKLLFDPPTSSTAVDAINRAISELEWRIQLTVDPILNGEEV